MLRNAFLGSLLLASVALAVPTLAADEPTLHQVYEAANAGRLNDAQSMMDKVLQSHPNSAKAHFVEAEIMARQGRNDSAASELGTAERLAPGLPFAKPDSVEKLRQRITPGHAVAHAYAQPATAQTASGGGIPWAMLLMGIGLVAALIFFVRSLNRRSTYIPAGGGAAYGPGYGAAQPMQPYGPAGMAPTMGPAAGGIGSGILGGLATGAAVGAGMVAGEALMHHFTDGNRSDSGLGAFPAPTNDNIAPPDDLGGSDFGIADSGSWDDASGGGGGDDWN